MKMNQKNPMRMMIGRIEMAKPIHWGGLRIVTEGTLDSSRCRSESVITAVVRNERTVRGSPPISTWVGSRSWPSMLPLLRSTTTDSTRPSSTSRVKVEKLMSLLDPPDVNWLTTKIARMISITSNHGLKDRLKTCLPAGSESAAASVRRASHLVGVG